MKKTLALTTVLAVATYVAHAGIVINEDFSGDSYDSSLNVNVGGQVHDTVNNQLDYSHTSGDLDRFGSDNNVFITKQGYAKVTISNYTAGQTWMGFSYQNPGHTGHYASLAVTANGVYELVVNNTTGTISFDNDNGWTGSLAAGTGLWTTDGGQTTAALTFGSSVAADSSFEGFNLVDARNTTIYPSSLFSIDEMVVSNTAAIPEPATIGLVGAFGGAVIFIRRRLML